MVKGIGVDIIEIARVKKAIESTNYSFVKKVFTDNEIKYCEQQKNKFQHYAVRFAAKEAVLKAFSLGWNSGNWKNIEVLTHTNNAPYIVLKNKMKKLCRTKKIKKIFVSLSHFNSYAIAFVVAE
jgi:holo-[acyl-carrier protein] synthase